MGPISADDHQLLGTYSLTFQTGEFHHSDGPIMDTYSYAGYGEIFARIRTPPDAGGQTQPNLPRLVRTCHVISTASPRRQMNIHADD